MQKKLFSLKNYLEPIDLEDFKEEEDNELFENEFSQPYPFTKKSLLQFLESEKFLSSFSEGKQLEELQKKDEKISIKHILTNISVEKKQEEIKIEKRKRYQAYKMLDFTLSNFTYFDFFSADAFEIAKNSKYIAQLYGKQKVNLEILFLSFFDSEFQLVELLKSFGFDEAFLEKFSLQIKTGKRKETNVSGSLSIFEGLKTQIQNVISQVFPFEEKELAFNQQIRFQYQVHQLFEKSADNALNRFKTPVITPEIVLITLMEDKESLVGRLIKKNILDETDWYLLRYKLIKRLYAQESNVRSQVKKNQQFFAYLLKTQLPEASFNKLIEKKALGKAVSLFRNTLIHDVLKTDFWDSFEAEIHASIAIGPKRFYST